MTTVCVAVPPVEDLYPWRPVRAGLEKAGLQALSSDKMLDGDILVTWSPWRGSRREALQRHYSEQGKPVLVMENGFLSPIAGKPYFQLALDGWNGTGTFPAEGPARYRSWNLAELPWKGVRGGYALIVGQRGHPSDPRTAPPDWHETLVVEGMPVIRRGRESMRPLGLDVLGATEVHVWTSSVAAHAILAGIPVVQHGPNLMTTAMASRPGEPLYRGSRADFDRLAWAQWSADELATGTPFSRILEFSRESRLPPQA